ncbi:methyltransferase domain-containing protein [Xylariales sp. PMI_506]|nr:methyltransferase domain-containing protein [Xylariales sp. PMI_506]
MPELGDEIAVSQDPPFQLSDSSVPQDEPSCISSMIVPEFLASDDGSNDFTPSSPQFTGSAVLAGDSISEHGRTYQGYRQGKYFLPNDPEEQDRLDMQHANILVLMDGKLAWAPTENPKKVLDIGTGTGIWATEFAEQHPEASVTGIDLSLIQPSEVPQNCTFVRGDVEEESWAAAGPYDYIHLRMTFSCFDDPGAVLRRARERLAPGGWIELQDMLMDFRSYDGSARGSALEAWTALLVKGGAAAGRDMQVPRRYAGLLAAAGFVDVREHVLPSPCSQWARDPKFKSAGGLLAAMLLKSGLEGVSIRPLAAAGLSPAEIAEHVAAGKRDVRDPAGIHGYWPFYVVYARKPTLEETRT